MSLPATQKAWIQICRGWEDRFEEHPIWAWQHALEKEFDFGTMKQQDDYTGWHVADYRYTSSIGVTSTGAAAWAAERVVYAPFPQHYHEPFFAVIYETAAGGYELFGCAKIFANLPVPGGEKKCKDLDGKEWDVEAIGAFHFGYVKDDAGPMGFKLSFEKLYADPTPLVGELVKRGMVSAEIALGVGA